MSQTSKNSQKHIIVIDDDPIILRILDTLLQKNGFRVSTVSLSSFAVQKIIIDKPDLVILDLLMPMFLGTEILNYLNLHPSINVPVLVMSSARHMKKEVMLKGAADFIDKPFIESELIYKINKLCR